MKNNQQAGFSLVEIAIVMVIIGVIMAAVAIGKDTKMTADATQLFKKRVESCVVLAYGIGDWTQYDGSEIDVNGRSLKHFCEIKRKADGTMEAKIHAPSNKMAILMYNKAMEKLSPDDFIVQSNAPENNNFSVTINNMFSSGLETDLIDGMDVDILPSTFPLETNTSLTSLIRNPQGLRN